MRSNFCKRIFKSKTDKRGGGLEKTEFTDTIKRADFFGYIIKGTGTAKRILRSSLSDRGDRTAAEAPEDILRETNTKQLFLYLKSGKKQEKKPKKSPKNPQKTLKNTPFLA